MPSVSKAQKRFMAAAAHDATFAKKAGISQTTAKEWNQKDKEAGKKKLPEKVDDKKKKASNETYMTTATLTGLKGFKDQ